MGLKILRSLYFRALLAISAQLKPMCVKVAQGRRSTTDTVFPYEEKEQDGLFNPLLLK